jgi:glycerophosphoryl diester phosphodiesterase
MVNNIVRVAHRGASGYEPENTLLSFKKAIELGADMIEFDVRVCESGELVVMHDDSVDRTTNGKGKIEDKELAELKSLDESKGQKIPTLIEVLDFVDKKIKLDIELKDEGIVKEVSDIIKKYIEKKGWSYDDFMVSSFHHNELRQLKEINPEIRIGVLSEEVPPGFLHFAKKIKAYSVNTPVDRINGKFVENAHKNGLKVFVFAANDTPEIDKAKSLGVDYICSNFPDKI